MGFGCRTSLSRGPLKEPKDVGIARCEKEILWPGVRGAAFVNKLYSGLGARG